MTVYLDTADVARARPLLATGIFGGVTTTPLILAKAGLGSPDRAEVVEAMARAGAKRVFVQAVGRSTADLLADAARLAGELGPLMQVAELVLKVPATSAGLSAVGRLPAQWDQVLLTALYHPAQALAACALAPKVGYAAPYLGRIDEQLGNGEQAVLQIAQICARAGVETVAASIRSLDQIGGLAAGGVGSFTLNCDLAEQLANYPPALAAAAEFNRAAGLAGD
ncbi:MAG: hypothetical protein LBH68_07150 [Bifidobacteriaceae bacterium]|jgi:transaldolase|nr:hypothetical protein [Bifidobacteriaceae bacterium]